MGDIIRFDPERRGKRKWTRPEDYGFGPDPEPEPPRQPKRPRRRSRERRRLGPMRLWLLIVTVIALWVVLGDPRLGEVPGFLQTAPETVAASFTRCGKGGGGHCVIDGDTFRIGERSIRVTGIDAPEVKARCDAEAAAAERASEALRDWLSRGRFQMTARLGDPKDRYGREVRILKRVGEGGEEERLADFMVAGGYARPYRLGLRGSWC
jgi:micrococcal nuclease